jgi:hypothetical protein
MVSDSGWRPGYDPWEMQSAAEAKQAEHRAEQGADQHVRAGPPAAADARSFRGWLPILAILAVGFVVLLILSLPR